MTLRTLQKVIPSVAASDGITFCRVRKLMWVL